MTLLGRLGSGTVTHLDLSWNDLGIEGHLGWHAGLVAGGPVMMGRVTRPGNVKIAIEHGH